MADLTVIYRAQERETAPRGYVLTKLVDLEDGTYAPGITIVGLDTPVELTGEVSVAVWGALDDAAEPDPDAASATVPSLLRGTLASVLSGFTDVLSAQGDALSELQSLNTAIGAAGDSAGDPTVIGLLKQIAANTDPG